MIGRVEFGPGAERPELTTKVVWLVTWFAIAALAYIAFQRSLEIALRPWTVEPVDPEPPAESSVDPPEAAPE